MKKRLPLPRVYLNHDPHPLRMYSYKRVGVLFGRSAWAIRRWHKDGLMPPPVKLPGGQVAWPEPVLVQWVNSLQKEEA